MIALGDVLRTRAKRLLEELGQLKLPHYSSSRAYEREWYTRQHEALRRAMENNRQTVDR